MGFLCGESDLSTDRWPLGECLVGGCVVREGGLEPPHPFGHRHLKPARLPIPPLARGTPLKKCSLERSATPLDCGRGNLHHRGHAIR